MTLVEIDSILRDICSEKDWDAQDLFSINYSGLAQLYANGDRMAAKFMRRYLSSLAEGAALWDSRFVRACEKADVTKEELWVFLKEFFINPGAFVGKVTEEKDGTLTIEIKHRRHIFPVDSQTRHVFYFTIKFQNYIFVDRRGKRVRKLSHGVHLDAEAMYTPEPNVLKVKEEAKGLWRPREIKEVDESGRFPYVRSKILEWINQFIKKHIKKLTKILFEVNSSNTSQYRCLLIPVDNQLGHYLGCVIRKDGAFDVFISSDVNSHVFPEMTDGKVGCRQERKLRELDSKVYKKVRKKRAEFFKEILELLGKADVDVPTTDGSTNTGNLSETPVGKIPITKGPPPTPEPNSQVKGPSKRKHPQHVLSLVESAETVSSQNLKTKKPKTRVKTKVPKTRMKTKVPKTSAVLSDIKSQKKLQNEASLTRANFRLETVAPGISSQPQTKKWQIVPGTCTFGTKSANTSTACHFCDITNSKELQKSFSLADTSIATVEPAASHVCVPTDSGELRKEGGGPRLTAGGVKPKLQWKRRWQELIHKGGVKPKSQWKRRWQELIHEGGVKPKLQWKRRWQKLMKHKVSGVLRLHPVLLETLISIPDLLE